jgi:hypothetical protein
MRIRATAATAAVFLCTASLGCAENAPPGPGQFTNYGPGTASCGTWLAEHGTPMQQMQHYVLGSSVLGWVTAAGYYGAHLRHTDADAISAWVDNYCREHPLNKIQEAAAILVDELSKPK